MTLKPARPSEAPVTEWETFEGETFGYDEEGNRVIDISARTLDTSWTVASNVRGWAAHNPRGRSWETGQADGLRAAKKAALAALRAFKGDA